MRIFDLQPTDQNVMDTYTHDVIGRNEDVFRFVNMLNAINRPFSISVDAQWGSGKTFFVKQAKLVLDAFNPYTNCLGESEVNLIQSTWQRIKGANKLELQPQVTVYYDAWRNDNDTDPVLSLIYTILQTVDSDYPIKESTGLIHLAAGFVDAFQGTNMSNLLELLRGDDPLKTISSQKELEKKFADFLNSLLAERGNRLVIFIDELDRCKPSFAVKLLERIKHYFFNERITFVFSVNTDELQHTIRKHYGVDFDACRYLDRFFDFRLLLPPADMEYFLHTAGLAPRHHVFDGICKSIIDIYGFTFREATRFLQTAFTAAYKPTHGKNTSFWFGDDYGEFFCIACIVPLMIALQMKDYRKYSQFISGNDSSPLHELFSSSDSVGGLKRNLLADGETYSTFGEAGADKVVSLKEKLDQVYDLIFKKASADGMYNGVVGKCNFVENTRDDVLRIACVMSDYADFNID